MLEFNTSRLIFIIVVTIVLAIWSIRKLNTLKKILILFVFAFVCLYSGIGGALVNLNDSYCLYYCAYILIMALTIKYTSLGFNLASKEDSIKYFIDTRYKAIITLYFCIRLCNLIWPEFKLLNIIHPPAPSLEDFDFENAGNNYGGGMISTLLYLMINIITPFFYLALYKFRNQSFKVSLLILINVYLMYCHSGYIGRGTILQTLIVISLVVYFNLSRRKKKIFITSCLCILPALVYLFFQYSVIRSGNDTISDISISKAVEVVFGQEVSYPLHFNDYINSTKQYALDYLQWLILLPLPGFMKFGLGGFALNQEFSIQMLGVDVSDSSFFIVLPGLVGESLFVFGTHWWFIHAIIVGLVIKFAIKTFFEAKSTTFLAYMLIVSLSFHLARAGTPGVYPAFFKGYIILAVFCRYFIHNKPHSR